MNDLSHTFSIFNLKNNLNRIIKLDILIEDSFICSPAVKCISAKKQKKNKENLELCMCERKRERERGKWSGNRRRKRK